MTTATTHCPICASGKALAKVDTGRLRGGRVQSQSADECKANPVATAVSSRLT